MEHMVSGHHAYQNLLEKVYKELTSLGLISFALFIIQDRASPDPALVHAFEFAHYLIFAMAMIFILNAVVSMRGCLGTKRQWDRTAATSMHSVCEEYKVR